MPTKRCRLSRIVLVSLFGFVVSVLVEESDQHILRSSRVESLCLRRCLLRAVKRSKTKVSTFSCYRNCINRNNEDQEALTANAVFKQRVRRRALTPFPECGVSSPNQSEDWAPEVVNVTFGQYENTSYWYVNVSWTPLNDSCGNWSHILVKLLVFTPTNKRLFGRQTTCSVHPKNLTFLNINISSHHYEYPSPILLKVGALPYSPNQDDADIKDYYPPGSSDSGGSDSSSSSTSSTTTYGSSVNQTVSYVSIAIGILLGLLLILSFLKCMFVYIRRRKRNRVPVLEDFDYHAFIIYSSKDSDWVQNKLRIPLEEKYHLKCCIHFRDFDPGGVFLESMADSVDKSFKIIAVFSKNFQESKYCRHELQLATYRQVSQGDDCLVIIRIDDTKFSKLPKGLQGRSVIDYFKTVERPFWMSRLLQFLRVPEDSDNQDAVTEQERNTNNRRDSRTGRRKRHTFVRLRSTSSNETAVSFV